MHIEDIYGPDSYVLCSSIKKGKKVQIDSKNTLIAIQQIKGLFQ